MIYQLYSWYRIKVIKNIFIRMTKYYIIKSLYTPDPNRIDMLKTVGGNRRVM